MLLKFSVIKDSTVVWETLILILNWGERGNLNSMSHLLYTVHAISKKSLTWLKLTAIKIATMI